MRIVDIVCSSNNGIRKLRCPLLKTGNCEKQNDWKEVCMVDHFHSDVSSQQCLDDPQHRSGILQSAMSLYFCGFYY